jgi:glycosyltransferase involved in cell wall biosynthesis
VRQLIQELQIEEHVRITGYAPYEEFLEYIALSDVCVNLRYPTVRATSANILKIMAFAKPAVVSDVCEFLDLPDTCCLKIPLNETEEERLLQAFQRLHVDPDYRKTVGAQAREFISTRHTLQQAADKYLAFCQRILQAR